MTLETELPKIIAKEDRLPEPDKKAFEDKMKSFDAEVEKTKDEVAKISKAIKLKAEGGRMAGSNETVHEALQGQIRARGNVYDELEEIKARVEAIKKELGDKIEEKKQIEKKLEPGCKTAQAIEKRMKDIDVKLQTSTMSIQDENSAIKRQKFLKESLKFIDRYETLEPRIEALKEERKGLLDRKTELRETLDDVKAKIDATKSELEATRGKKEDNKAEMDVLGDKREAMRKRIPETYQKKDALREEFYKQMFDYAVQQDEIKHIEGMHRLKKRLAEEEEDKKRRKEERRIAKENRGRPYETEIYLCDHLQKLCRKMKRDYDEAKGFAAAPAEEDAKEEKEEEGLAAVLAQNFEKQLKDGKVEYVKPKKEREAAEVYYAGNKKDKRRKRKQKGPDVPEQL